MRTERGGGGGDVIITVHVDEAVVAEAAHNVARLLVHSVPGICAADARDLARQYVQEELEKHLADEARDLLDDMALFGVLGDKLPADLVEKARKAAQRIGGRG